MVLEIIKLLEVEERTAKNGKKYKGFKTSSGAMSCFDYNIVAELEKHIGQAVKVDYKVVNNFKNITAFLGKSEPENPVSTGNEANSADFLPVLQEKGNIISSNILEIKTDPRLASMILSYAKDLCCSDKCEYKDIENVCITLKKIHDKISKE